MENATNQSSYTNDSYDINPPRSAKIFLMVVLSLVFLLGTTGNGLVIWFVIIKMKKTVNSVWFLSLAIADFTFSLFQSLEVTQLALYHHWPFGDFMCKVYWYVVMLNMFSSILQLTIISIDRCIIVVYPVWCSSHRTPRLALQVTLIIWILAAAFSIPFAIRRVTEAQEHGPVYCTEPDYALDEFFFVERAIIRKVFFFVIPFIIIVFCYMVIFCRIKKSCVETSTKPFKIMTAVIACFFICWLPYHVFFYILEAAIYYKNLYLLDMCSIGMPLSVSLAYTNSCINPFLYVFLGRDFKEKFWSSIQSALRRAFTYDTDQTEPKRDTASSNLDAGELSLTTMSIQSPSE